MDGSIVVIIVLSSIFAILLIIAFIFLKGLIRFRDNSIRLKQQINKLLSKIRLLKAKYVQTLNKTSERLEMSSNNSSKVLRSHTQAPFTGNFTLAKGVSLDINQMDEYATQQVNKLSDALLSSQKELNEKIQEYNLYITKTSHLVYKAILKYKTMDYIDADRLEKGLELSDDIDDYGI